MIAMVMIVVAVVGVTVLLHAAVVGMVGVTVLLHAAVVGMVGVTVLLHAAVVGMVRVRMLRMVIARVGVDMGHCKLPVGCVVGTRSRGLIFIIAAPAAFTQVSDRRLARRAVAVQVEKVPQRRERGPSRRLGQIAVDQVLQFVVQVYVLDGAAGHADEVVMVGQERFGQLEVGTIAADRDPVHHTRPLEHFEVAVGGADGQIGCNRRDLSQRRRASRSRKCLDQSPAPVGVAIVVSRQADPYHGVQVSKGGRQVRLSRRVGHVAFSCY